MQFDKFSMLLFLTKESKAKQINAWFVICALQVHNIREYNFEIAYIGPNETEIFSLIKNFKHFPNSIWNLYKFHFEKVLQWATQSLHGNCSEFKW